MAETEDTGRSWRERIVALRNVPLVLKILWESSTKAVIWGILLRIVVAVLPFAASRNAVASVDVRTSTMP